MSLSACSPQPRTPATPPWSEPPPRGRRSRPGASPTRTRPPHTASDHAGRYRFYYAHLDRYADGIREGLPVRRGDLLGYLGNSGNARWTRPHLHFQVLLTEPTGAWWKDGGTLNPYPILMALVRRQAAGRVAAR